jgi:hypothetical protein
VTDEDSTYDDIMGDIAIRAAANGGPTTSDILRAMRASHRDLLEAVRRNRDHTDTAIAACREAREEATAAAVELARIQAGQELDRRAVTRWLSDRARRAIIGGTVIVFAAATGLLLWKHDTAAAQVTGMLALMTPFLLLLFRRS